MSESSIPTSFVNSTFSTISVTMEYRNGSRRLGEAVCVYVASEESEFETKRDLVAAEFVRHVPVVRVVGR